MIPIDYRHTSGIPRPEHSWQTGSIPWLLMPRPFALPSHWQPRCWLCAMWIIVSLSVVNCNHLCVCCMCWRMIWDASVICFIFIRTIRHEEDLNFKITYVSWPLGPKTLKRQRLDDDFPTADSLASSALERCIRTVITGDTRQVIIPSNNDPKTIPVTLEAEGEMIYFNTLTGYTNPDNNKEKLQKNS